MNSVTHSVLQTAEVRIQAAAVLLTISTPQLRQGEMAITLARRHILVQAMDPDIPDLRVLLPVDVDPANYSTSLVNGVLEVRASRLMKPANPPS